MYSARLVGSTPIHATLSGERNVRIVAPAAGLEFVGYLDLRDAGPYRSRWVGWRLVVTQHGGADDGLLRMLIYDDGIG